MMNLSLLQDFIPETMLYLEDMENNLIRLESDPGNSRILNNVFRSVHMIKGSSEHMGVHRIAGLTHKMGSLLDVLRSAGISADKALVDILMRSKDKIMMLVGELELEGAGEKKNEIDDLDVPREALFTDGNKNSSKESNPDQNVGGKVVNEIFSELKFALLTTTSKGVSEIRKQLILDYINELLKVGAGEDSEIIEQTLRGMKQDVKTMIYSDDAGDILVSLNKLLCELKI